MSLHGLSAATINFKQVFTNHKIVFCLMETEFLFLVGFVHLPAAEILISCNLLPGSLCCWNTKIERTYNA